MPLLSSDALTCEIKETASLSEAVMWIAFHAVPVPYELKPIFGFDYSFQQLSEIKGEDGELNAGKIEQAKRQLFYNLHNRKIALFYFTNDPNVDEFLSKKTKLTPEESFSFNNVDFERSMISDVGIHIEDNNYCYHDISCCCVLTDKLFSVFPPPDGVIPTGQVAPMELIEKYRSCTLQPQPKETITPKPIKDQGGRPPKYDWDYFFAEIIRIANTPDGLPEKRELKKHMRDWVSKWDEQPSDSQINDKVNLVYPDNEN